MVKSWRSLWPDLQNSWRAMSMWPLFSWIHPELIITLVHSDERESYWLTNGRAIRKSNKAVSSNKLVAVELPEALVLRKQIQVPAMGSADLQAALGLEARSISPFAADDLVWGYGVGTKGEGRAGAELLLASRQQVAVYLADVTSRKGLNVPPQIWAFSKGGLPVAFEDLGLEESSRLLTMQKWVLIGLLTLALAILGGIVATPTAQLRLRAIEAVNGFTELVQASDPAIAKRAAVQISSEQVSSLVGLTAESVDALTLMARLTEWLPDDTSLISLTVKGNKIGLYGTTTNAATLMQHLSSIDGVKDVKAPQAAMRPSGASKDVFSIDFQYVPKAPEPKADVTGPTAEVPASVASAASATVPVPPVTAPQGGARVSPGGASFGGASFGGNSSKPEGPGRTGSKQ